MIASANFSQKLKKELHEIYFIQPNDLGWEWLTKLYKLSTSRLKKQPFIYLLPLSFIVVAGMYTILGNLFVRLVSLLQYGF